MASSEGIRSPFSLQPSARSPKLRLYETLFLWNQGVDQLVATFARHGEALLCSQECIAVAQAGSKKSAPT